MKKIYFLMLMIVASVASSCDSAEHNKEMYQKEFTKKQGRDWLIINLDGCEYLYFPDGNASWGTHKGNCNNPVHAK